LFPNLVCQLVPPLSGLRTASRAGFVSFTVGDSDQLTVPRPFRAGFIRSSFLASSKFLRFASRSPLVRATTPAWVSSLFAASPTTSTPFRAPCGVREFPTSRFVPPSGFLNLPAVCSVVSCAGLFHPAATSRVRFLPSRGFSRPAAVPSSSLDPAPLPFMETSWPATRPPLARCRLRGFVPQGRCVPRVRWLASPLIAPLFGFLLLRVLTMPPWARFPGPSARDVTCRSCPRFLAVACAWPFGSSSASCQ